MLSNYVGQAQVRDLTAAALRNDVVDMEYLKNVVVKYMECPNLVHQGAMPCLINACRSSR